MYFLTPLLFLCVLPSTLSRGLMEEFSWTRINFAWPGGITSESSIRPQEEQFAFSGHTYVKYQTTRRPHRPTRPRSTPRPGDGASNDSIPYIYQNNIPMGANVWNNKLFITIPRRRVGVPSTLNYVWVNSSERRNVPLIPYPDWETNRLGQSGDNRDRFVSVYRVAIDSCDRLWFVDTGLIETPGNPDRIQPVALVIMDLKTDRILHRHVFNSSLLQPASNLASLTIDVTNHNCRDAFAYIPDVGGYGLIVYSLREDRAWRVTHNFFYLEPLAGEFSIGGYDFQWNDGIFSLSLSGMKPDGYRDAFFHSMAGFNLYKVSTRVLKNETLATRSYHENDFQIVGHRGDRSQTSATDLDQNTGVLFLGLVNQNAVACWNINTPLRDISIVQKNDHKMIYPSDINISEENVVVLTNTMPVFLYGTLNYDVTNFRVWVETVATAIKGTKCDVRHGGGIGGIIY